MLSENDKTKLEFIHLHLHTHYSLLDGLSKIDEVLDKVKIHGMTAVAITDHGNMYGAIEFYKKAKKHELKPIIGIEVYIAPGRMRDKVPNGNENKFYHLILLAKNNTGYQNLITLTTKAHLEGYYYKPRIDKELLKKHCKGLIILSACLGGEISRLLINGHYEKAKETALEYQNMAGQGNYYLELQYHENIQDQKIISPLLLKLHRETSIPIVFTSDSHYIHPEDAEAHDVLLAVQTRTKTDDKDRMTFKQDDFSIFSSEEAFRRVSKINSITREEAETAILNTSKIAEMCNLELTLGEFIFPNFPLEPGKTADQMLDELTFQGLEEKGLRNDPQAEERRRYELDIIKNKNYSPYFLVVADLLRFARESKIYTTVRGSAAGSLVAYLSGITNVNPLEFQLPFERFLNPFRPSAPDIDMDFADNRRHEVIEYAKNKYGADKVAQIGTFGTMMARGAVRDVARALGKSYETGDRIAKLIPFGVQGFPMTIKHALEIEHELKKLYETDLEARQILDISKKLEGTVRHFSVHAAGVVIAPRPLENYVPTQFDPKGKDNIITQYDMYNVGEDGIGLTKLDFLGIRNLAILENAVKLVKEYRGIEIDIEKIPFDDKRTFEMLSRGETIGLFQLNGAGMTKHLMELKPTAIHDINAMVALYRPGPMNNIPEYIARKQGRSPIKYFHPKAEKFLDKSYGILVYQDDLLFTALELAGYSWETVDKFRKAVGKKIPAEMAKQHEIFVQGCQDHSGMSKEEAEKIWKLFEPFQGYGFNKCLSGDTLVFDYDSGDLIKIEDIYKSKKRVKRILSLNDNFTFSPSRVRNVFRNGTRRVFELITKSGRKIKATNNHPFLSVNGWKHLNELTAEDKIAVPRIITTASLKTDIPDFKLAVLGYLLAEGNLCHPHGVYFYSTQKEEIDDYIKNLNNFENTTAVLNTSKTATSVYSKRIDVNQKSELVDFIENLGLKYKTATEKLISSFVFNLPKEKIAVLIGKMFQGDGCINIKGNDQQIFYATSSEKLVYQLQHLLLRFGVLSTIHKKIFKYRLEDKTGFTLNISRWDNVEKFIRNFSIYFVGQKKDNCEYILKNHPIINGTLKKWSARGSKDVIPVDLIRDLLRTSILAENYSYVEFARTASISERLLLKDTRKSGYLRETIQKIAEILNNPEIFDIANSDLFWDEIKEIRLAGFEATYDLEIEGTHNFVANDFIVHNSHAACYGRVAYQTAYMKTTYPSEYMCAVLTAESGDIDKIPEIINESQRMGIPVLPPDISSSFKYFTLIKNPAGDQIRFGLLTIKNLGEHVADDIIKQRQKDGPYKNIEDFLNRVESKDLNKKSLESLIKCGALDNFGERGTLLANTEHFLRYSKEQKTNHSSGQISLFGNDEAIGVPTLRLEFAPPLTTLEKLKWEKELLGLYISDHPLKDYQQKFRSTYRASPIGEVIKTRNGRSIRTAGLLTKIQKIFTKTGKLMAFSMLEDANDKIEIVIFPNLFEKDPTPWQEDQIVIVTGKINERDGIPKLICDEVLVVGA